MSLNESVSGVLYYSFLYSPIQRTSLSSEYNPTNRKGALQIEVKSITMISYPSK